MARKPSRNEWRCSKSGLWSRSLGNRGTRIRLFEKRRGGTFYRDVWVSGRGRDRKCLGTADRTEADRLARELLAALLRDEQIVCGALPLGELWQRFSTQSHSYLDNHEKTKRDDEARARVLLGGFGAECDVRRLMEEDQAAYTQKRLAGGIVCADGRVTKAVRGRAVEADLKLLHAMLKWATTSRVRNGQRLLDVNPLSGARRIREQNPRRPVATTERFERTRAAIRTLQAEASSEDERRKWLQLEFALVLAEGCGRRLGSIRQLSWSDIDMTARTITWRAETDKKRKQWVIPIAPALLQEVQSFRVRMGGGFGGLIFPSSVDSTKAVRADVISNWLRAAEKKADLPKLGGSLWHAYRRGWATARKDFPVNDLSYAGGWQDAGTMLRCYIQPDDETLLRVMSEPRKVVAIAG